ncbi:MAG: hypothetical protein KKB90_11050 [Actinobacteria bacterium]|nr:hypothetical protein [Actinomycetota bacterium]MCG2820062.1 hypothetical protein [Actinomycetes bacterium]MBU4179649.1 hypothetical protein [Actinomycetota bacterium]MBU4219484.1 hypothetical protein [Actinomycetota bacterium]MBU4357899.1 hypothetical protein [Actinomycetota bacterium]
MRHVHQRLDEEIRSIGGYYKVLEEELLDFNGRKVLYVLKGAHVETSCCGEGGVGYISVPGYVSSWKSSTNEDGLAVSEVERVRGKEVQRQLRGILKKKYPYIDVIDFE